MKRLIGVGLAALGLMLGTAGVASADEQSYLAALDANGYAYGPLSMSRATAVKHGHHICDNIRYSGNPRDGFNMVYNAVTPDYMIAAAQSELCPGTL